MIDLDVDDYESAVVKTNNLFLSNLWADGLPIIPPTAEKIDWVLQGTDRPGDEQIGKFMPRGGIVTVETCAISLAMAGGTRIFAGSLGRC